jgi:LssY C-terminus
MCSSSRVVGAIRMGAAVLLLAIPVLAKAQQPLSITKLTIEKKPGEADGRAMATVGKKTGRIASQAVQAWIIMQGQGALLLLSPQKKGGAYRLRYYQADQAKGRLLGDVPFAQAAIAESKAQDSAWAFAMSGESLRSRSPIVLVGDTDAIHARLEGATHPQFVGDSLSFLQRGQSITISTARLLGQEAAGRIYAPSGDVPETAFLEFLPNGDALTIDSTGRIDHGRWMTDGSQFTITSPGPRQSVWQLSQLNPVTGVPATSRLSVRLLSPLSSRTAVKGMEVKAALISPGVFEGAILLPQGSEFDGKIVDAHGVGWGIKHETAALTVHFDSVKLPDGRTLPIDAHIFEVENARETVTASGQIQGVRATGTIGHSAENNLGVLAVIDPVAYVFTGVSGPAVLGFAESEILYNAGTELILEFDRPVITSQQYPPQIPTMRLTGQQATQFDAMVRGLSFRTRTQGTNKPSDITNLIFVGTPGAVRRAFEAAGWSSADALDAASTFNTLKTITGNQSYAQAPMSTLLLDEQPPLFTMQKSTNTFSSRHHVRVFATEDTFDGKTVLTASSTQDVAIAFSSRQKTFIHVIDQDIDNERSKVTNDLAFTGCLDGIDLVPRAWVPRDTYNSTGDRLVTDGSAAVLYMNDCTNPHTTPEMVAKRPPLFERSERDTVLTIKDTLFRSNVVYEGISGTRKVHDYLSTRGELGEDPTNWRKSDASGTQYEIYGAPHLSRRIVPWASSGPAEGEEELDAASRERIASHRWDPPRFEIGLNLGYSRYEDSVLETTLVALISSNPDEPFYVLGLGDDVYDGWAAGVSLTLNSWNWVSNEFTYMRQQTKFDLFALVFSTDPDQEPVLDLRTVGLATRRVAYNTVLNLRPRRSRWRPYFTAGPAFQLIALANAPLKQPSGFFRLGLSNIGLIKAAFDFGSTPPLDGGGIFQLGLQYGAGFKYRLLPRLTMRTDFGETWSQNPKIIRDSYIGYEPTGLDNTYTTTVDYIAPPSRFAQQRATIGFAFTF